MDGTSPSSIWLLDFRRLRFHWHVSVRNVITCSTLNSSLILFVKFIEANVSAVIGHKFLFPQHEVKLRNYVDILVRMCSFIQEFLYIPVYMIHKYIIRKRGLYHADIDLGHIYMWQLFKVCKILIIKYQSYAMHDSTML